MRTGGDEKGAILPYVIIVIFFLSFLWILSLSRTTGDIKLVGSRRMATTQFYSADSALVAAYENKGNWMTDDFLSDVADDVESAALTFTATDPLAGDLATMTFRPIQDEDEAAAAANNLPVQRHEVPPPTGSGFGLNKFVVKRFGIDAVSPDGSREVQAGVWVLLNK